MCGDVNVTSANCAGETKGLQNPRTRAPAAVSAETINEIYSMIEVVDKRWNTLIEAINRVLTEIWFFKKKLRRSTHRALRASKGESSGETGSEELLKKLDEVEVRLNSCRDDMREECKFRMVIKWEVEGFMKRLGEVIYVPIEVDGRLLVLLGAQMWIMRLL